MIDRAEIMQLAGELGLRPDVVEKDYVLGWLLAAISQDEVLGPAWVFKGGTCLKKCFFETYRFSEDLDFTVTDSVQIDRDFLLQRFRGVAAWLYDESGIELPADLFRFDVYDNARGRRAAQGRIAYRDRLFAVAISPASSWTSRRTKCLSCLLSCARLRILIPTAETAALKHAVTHLKKCSARKCVLWVSG